MTDGVRPGQQVDADQIADPGVDRLIEGGEADKGAKGEIMRSHLITLAVALFASIPLFAQAPQHKAAIVAFAQEAAVRALNFPQGDIKGLTRARADFTPEGWKAFMRHMQGWLDPKGAPTFSSSFVPSGNAVEVGRENGILHLRIPGTLRQTQNQSSTTYNRAAIEVQVGGQPIKIHLLEQITCLGGSTACQ